MSYTAAVLTISDLGSRGQRLNRSAKEHPRSRIRERGCCVHLPPGHRARRRRRPTAETAAPLLHSSRAHHSAMSMLSIRFLCFFPSMQKIVVVSSGKQGHALLQQLQLTLQVVFVLEQRVVYAGPDEHADQRGDGGVRDAQLGLQLPGVGGAALVEAREKPLPMLNIFGMGVDLVHQAVFFAVLPGRPVGDLLDVAHGAPHVGGGLGHELVLHLGHAVVGGLDDEVVQVVKILVQRGGVAAAGGGDGLYPHPGQAVLRVAGEAFFHQLYLFRLPRRFVYCAHVRPVLFIN